MQRLIDSLLDIFIILFGLTLAIASAVALFDLRVIEYLVPRPPSQKQTAVGKVTDITNEVRRRESGSVIWSLTSPDQTLFEKDRIFTATDSEATFQLDQGGVISIGPNTLIEISLNENYGEFNLVFGNFFADLNAGESIRVKSGKGELVVASSNQKSKVQLQKLSSSSEVNLIATSGTSHVSVNDGKAQNLSPDKPLTYDNKKSALTGNKIRLISPQSKTMFPPNKMIGFRWHADAELAQPQIEFSKTPAFDNIQYSHPALNNEEFLAPPLSPGIYYWRIRSQQSTSYASTIYIQTQEISLLSPPNQFKTTVDKNESISIKLSWSAIFSHNRYHITVWRKNNRKWVKRIATQTNNLELQIKEPDTYYWKVTVPQTEPLMQSATYAFYVSDSSRIENKQMPSLALAPLPGTDATAESPLNMPLPSKTEPKSQPPHSEKKNVNPSQADLKQQDKLKPLKAAPLPLAGWKKDKKQYSKAIAFENLLYIAEQGSDISIPLPKEYDDKTVVVKLSKNKDLSKVEKTFTTKPPLKVKLRDFEPRYLQVSSDSGAGQAKDKSPIIKIQLIKDLYLNIPQLNKPENDSRLTQINLSWGGVSQAHGYEIQISMDDIFPRNATQSLFSSNHRLKVDSLPNGNYWWRVRAITDEVKSDWSETRTFNFTKR